VPDATAHQAVVDELVGNAHGNLERVKELLDEHPDLVNARATWNETPIEAATQMGNRKIIDFLIERGAPIDDFTSLVLGTASEGVVNQRGIHDLPALYFAAIGGHVDTARQLLSAGADVNARAEAAAPIHGAVMGGSVPMVRLLLDHGADVSLKDYAGRGARELALAINRDDMADMFDG
jgi:ankyrin repeat protein